MSFSTLTSPRSKHASRGSHLSRMFLGWNSRWLVSLGDTVRVQFEVLPPRECLLSPNHERSQCVSSTLSTPRAKHASRGNRLSTNVSLVNLTLARVPEKHRAASNLMSFRHESIFILLFTESHNGSLLFDIALVRAPFTRQSLATNVSVKKKKQWQVSLRNTMPRSI